MVGMTVNFTGITFVCLSLIVLVSRHFTLRRAKSLVQEDEKLYNCAWNDVCICSDNTEAIRELCDVAGDEPTWASCEEGQYNRATTQGGGSYRTGDGIEDLSRAASSASNISAVFQSTGSALVKAISSVDDMFRHSLDHLRNSPSDSPKDDDNNGIMPRSSDSARNLWRKTLLKQPWLRGGITDKEFDELIDGCPGIVDTSSPVKNIDQLYAQAAGLDIVLLRFIQVRIGQTAHHTPVVLNVSSLPGKNCTRLFDRWMPSIRESFCHFIG